MCTEKIFFEKSIRSCCALGLLSYIHLSYLIMYQQPYQQPWQQQQQQPYQQQTGYGYSDNQPIPPAYDPHAYAEQPAHTHPTKPHPAPPAGGGGSAAQQALQTKAPYQVNILLHATNSNRKCMRYPLDLFITPIAPTAH
jgi:hypothetical protein